MMNMVDSQKGSVQLTYIAPTRGLLGFRYQFLNATRGNGVMNAVFHGYDSMAGSVPTRSTGSIVAWEAGSTTNFVTGAVWVDTASDAAEVGLVPGTFTVHRTF